MFIIKKRYFLGLVIICLTIGAGVVLFDEKERVETILEYHQLYFSEYANYLEYSLEEAGDGNKISLKRAVGGVVSHHIPTVIPELVDFYLKIKNNREVDTFIIIGPDHVDGSLGNINVSHADFITPFGTLKPNLDIINKLEQLGLIVSNEYVFEKEHSIGSQVLVISKLFPNARIVPIVFRSSLTNEVARFFGEALASVADENVFVVASVDFSHYFTEQQARPLDQLSASVLSTLDQNAEGLIEADSPQTLAALAAFLDVKGIKENADMKTLNTRDFNNNNDNTTGYVFGFWGIP